MRNGSDCVKCDEGKKTKVISCSGVEDISPACEIACEADLECDDEQPESGYQVYALRQC